MVITNRSILYIDDDADDRELFLHAMNEIDPFMEVVLKESGSSGLAFLIEAKNRGTLPALIVIDMRMPVLTGRQTLTLIKDDPTLSRLEVAMFSTRITPPDARYFQELNVKVYHKPAAFPLLVTLLQQLVSSCKNY